ncbi:MAG: hypothetical protein K8L99_03045 [Anaerolineae bacterium]|nr:hypothetical protein [Anaerolineae bacterium]
MMQTYSLILVLLCGALFGTFGTSAQTEDEPSGGRPWDLKDTEQTGMFTFYDTPAQSSTTGQPLAVGDFDGNGCGDIAVAGQNASVFGSEGLRTNAGHLRIIMNLCQIGGRIALEENTSLSHIVLTINGARADDMAGTQVYVDDFNNDGYDDLLFGAQNSAGHSGVRPNAGAAYLVLGSSDFADQSTLDLLASSANVITFYGAAREDRFGIWVDGGDFDGDGYADLLIGANQADGEVGARINAGEAWIIYGSSNLTDDYVSPIDMAYPPSTATRIIGADPDDLLGSTTLGGDLNNDGYDDAIVSAALWRGSAGLGGLDFGGGDGPGNARFNSGDTFIIFGRSSLRGEVIDLASLLDNSGVPINEQMAVVYGADANDLLGEEIAIGDLNGDGKNDLVLGTLVAAGLNNWMEAAGEAWVIYGKQPFPGRMIDLANPPQDQALVIYPDQPDSKGGDILRLADIDGDGIDDLFYGAPNYDPVGYDLLVRQNAGMLAVIFGQFGDLPNTGGYILLPSNLEDLRISYVIGADAEDMMAYGLAVYDVDGDEVPDIIPNGMGGDGLNNDQINAGEIYVISGAEFVSVERDKPD